ncbi:hypothetical protein DSM21852_22510 [Methylocystis bryophila]|nr:hypothetical protein DSM21852_22510 [Methylocystis bryophila]
MLVDGEKKLGAIALRAGLLETCHKMRLAAPPMLSFGNVCEGEKDRNQRQAQGERGAVELDSRRKLYDSPEVLRLGAARPAAGGKEE